MSPPETLYVVDPCERWATRFIAAIDLVVVVIAFAFCVSSMGLLESANKLADDHDIVSIAESIRMYVTIVAALQPFAFVLQIPLLFNYIDTLAGITSIFRGYEVYFDMGTRWWWGALSFVSFIVAHTIQCFALAFAAVCATMTSYLPTIERPLDMNIVMNYLSPPSPPTAPSTDVFNSNVRNDLQSMLVCLCFILTISITLRVLVVIYASSMSSFCLHSLQTVYR